jgi:hypothetical protein
VEAVEVVCHANRALDCEVQDWVTPYCSSLEWRYECTDRTDYVTDDIDDYNLNQLQWQGKKTVENVGNTSLSTNIISSTEQRANHAENDYAAAVSDLETIEQDAAALDSANGRLPQEATVCDCSQFSCLVKKWGVCVVPSPQGATCRATCKVLKAQARLARSLRGLTVFLVERGRARIAQALRLVQGAALLLSSLPVGGWKKLEQVVEVQSVSALQGGGPPPADGSGPGYAVEGSMLDADFSTSDEVDLNFEAIESQGYDQTTDSLDNTAGGFGGLFMEVAADVADIDSNNRRLSTQEALSHVEFKEQLRDLSRKLRSARYQALVVGADLAATRARNSASTFASLVAKKSRSRALAKHEEEELERSGATANRLQTSINKLLSSSKQMISGLHRIPPRPQSLKVVRRGAN